MGTTDSANKTKLKACRFDTLIITLKNYVFREYAFCFVPKPKKTRLDAHLREKKMERLQTPALKDFLRVFSGLYLFLPPFRCRAQFMLQTEGYRKENDGQET